MEERRREKSGWEWSDDGLAHRFCEFNPGFRWVDKWNRWYWWSGKVWECDETLLLDNAVREFLRDVSIIPGDERKAIRLTSARTNAAVQGMCRSDERFAAKHDQFDTDPEKLNTPDGVIDLRTGRVSDHDPANHMMKITKAGPAGERPRWLQFLNEVTDGDQELIDYLRRVAGYCLTGTTKERVLFFLYGTGSNGKTTFVETLTGLMGEYAKVASMDTFTVQRGSQHTTELAMLHGARLVVAEETQAGRRWNETRIKALTGGNPITARFMYQDNFTFRPNFKLLIAGNHKPRLSNVDAAMRRRLHLIPFTVSIQAVDPDLPIVLQNEWAGICAWAVHGCLDYLDGGLRKPAVVRDATDDYFETQDTFAAWVDSCCVVGSNKTGGKTALWNSWKYYAEQANEYAGAKSQFTERMQAAGYEDGRVSSKRLWMGISLGVDYQEYDK